MIRNAAIFACAVAAASVPIAGAPGRHAITPEQVATALNQRGMAVSVDQLMMLSNAVANTDNPKLKVKSVERLDDQREAVRLECSSQQQCLPFVVTMQLNKGAEEVQDTSSGIRPKLIAVHDGSMATLHLNGTHVHIVVTVICLENGSVGQTIRATSIDRQKTYMVRVTGNELLEASL